MQHSAEDVPLAGVFIDGPEGTGKVGVLVIQTFNTETAEAAREFQTVVQNYIAAAQSQKVTKHIIDVRTNGAVNPPIAGRWLCSWSLDEVEDYLTYDLPADASVTQ